jgi:uncharacterized protein involved in type VI secretion and phage assembly
MSDTAAVTGTAATNGGAPRGAPRVHGQFRGRVVDNDDPRGLCRVRVVVPEVLGEQETGWCRAAMPYAGDGVGFAAVPPVDSLVFVEWPAGDIGREPIYTGATWADGTGVDGAGPDAVLLVTPAGNRIELRDTSGGEQIVIEASTGATVTMDSNGLVLAFGSQKVAMTNQSVSVNDGALEVR